MMMVTTIIIMHRASVCARTHTVDFTSELYACAWFDGYLGGGNQGELVFGTRMSDADAVACMRFARRRSSRPRRRGAYIDISAAAADIILLLLSLLYVVIVYAQCVYKKT